MDQETSRRKFLQGTTVTAAGLLAGQPHGEHQHGTAQQSQEYSRNHAGPGGPVGSPTDRGAKEFHLHAQPVQRELLPGNFMNHWGYNGTMPGPTIQVTEGDRVRIILHNELPEPTSLHLHGLELPNVMDGVPNVTQDAIKPGGTGVYELTVHQTGTYFYDPHEAMQEAI